MKRNVFKPIVGVVALSLLACAFAACGGSAGSPEPEYTEVSTDQMWEEEKTDETIYVFAKDSGVFTVDMVYPIGTLGQPLEDGCFYKLTADVTYLNGGVAGYVDFPEIRDVSDCEEVSPFDMNLPQITEKRYGMTLIGDYADGDVFLYEGGMISVWKDGAWIYDYDKTTAGDDGTLICYREEISEEEAKAGAAEGILCCEDFFVLPPQE